MKIPVSLQHKGKSYIHGIQGLIVFLAWALTIAVFTKDGKTDGRTKYYFALVRISRKSGCRQADENLLVLVLYSGIDLPRRGAIV